MKGHAGARRRNRSANPPAQDNQATKERLLQVATALFAQKGFHGVSTREITRQARANLSSLYFHWRSKENLYLAAYRDLFQRLAALSQEFFALLEKGLRTHESLEQVIYPLADLVFDFYEANPELARLNLHRVLEDGAVAMQVEQEFENPFYHTLARCYQRLTEAGFIHVSDPEFLPFSLEILLDLYFANPKRLERRLRMSQKALQTRLRNHFRETFLRLVKGT
jgi:AcrR family transcriptional regulator